jgi:acyl carrier protein
MNTEDKNIATRVNSIAETILKLPPGNLDSNATRDNTPAWDSLAHLSLVMELEHQFKTRFTTREIEEFVGLPAIVAVLKSKGVV